MDEIKRNNGSLFFAIFLMIVFFSVIHIEKEKNIPEHSISSAFFSSANSSNAKAIIAPTTSIPDINFCRIDIFNGKYMFPGCILSGEMIVNKLNICHFGFSRIKFLFNKPVIGLSFLQKVPGMEKSDDLPPIV
jgi:hypothetical protein